MDHIPDYISVSQNQKDVFILVRLISYGRMGRNHQGASGSTFLSLEEGSNFVQNSRQLKKKELGDV